MKTARRSSRSIVDLFNEASAAAFKKIWPIGKFPVLRDEARDRTVPESSIIIEYLAQHYPGKIAARSGRCGAGAADAPARPLLRPLCERAHAEDRHGQAAPGGEERYLRRRAGEDAAADVPRHGRPGHGDQDLGDGRRLHHGRLRRGAVAVLRQHGAALRRHPQERGALPGPPAWNAPPSPALSRRRSPISN